MMDGLSGASGVIAVISLAVQLCDSIKTLSDFFASIEAAPNYVSSIIEDLVIISGIADSIRHEASESGPHTRSLNTCLSALLQCSAKGNQLRSLLSKYELNSSSSKRFTRKWAACKIVWKTEEISRASAALRD